MAVEGEIREALTNLFLNAFDAMPQGGTLRLRTRVVRGMVQVEISDTGTGMDEETRRRCLEPFYTTKGERGTGLGLAMVFGVAERHGADLEIESALGKGTTFRLTFPAAATTVPSGPASAPAAPVAAAKLRVLVVDDDPLVAKVLRDTIKSDGHEVVIANGGQAGIDAFRSSRSAGQGYDVVMTDLGMPYVDGRKVAAAVKESSPATPVILLTGWGQSLLEDGEMPAHVDRLLSKPPRMAELREALAACAPAAMAAGAKG
jgi:CheY-like chemotaxis protein